jgi:hypothetical protein
MPRRVDYPSRFEFFRRAAFVLVRNDGPRALSRRAVADRGYVPDGLTHEVRPAAVDPLQERLAGHDARVDEVVASALAAMGIEDEARRRLTSSLVSGLVTDTCLGKIRPDEAVATLEHHLASLEGPSSAPSLGWRA